MVVTHHTDRITDAMMTARSRIPRDTFVDVDGKLDIDFHEHSAYHIAKSIAQAQGSLTVDEAWTICKRCRDLAERYGLTVPRTENK